MTYEKTILWIKGTFSRKMYCKIFFLGYNWFREDLYSLSYFKKLHVFLIDYMQFCQKHKNMWEVLGIAYL